MADKTEKQVKAREGVYIRLSDAGRAALDKRVADASKACGVQLTRDQVLTGVVNSALGIK